MSNTFNQFQKLVGTSSIDVVTIVSNNGDGTSNATTLSGVSISVKGESVTSGNKAFIRANEILRQAPSYAITEVII